jgi:alkylated DNA repair dioxygenase AlkB
MQSQSTLFELDAVLGGVRYVPDFIALKEADELLVALLRLNWNQHVYHATGKAPRLYVWMGVPYVSPNLASKNVVTEWTSEAKRTKERVEHATGCTFDSLNMNRYRNERDSIGWHADGEAEGRWDFPIASVSLGAIRKFQWKRKTDGMTASQPVEHGSLLIMPAGFQRDYLHQIPKQQRPCGERINLTFRRKR